MRSLTLLLLLAALWTSCKKNVEFPAEVRPNEFWARYTVTNDSGQIQLYDFQGEDTTLVEVANGLVVALDYFTEYDIQNNVKQITAGLGDSWNAPPISIRLKAAGNLNSPFTPLEWSADELAQLIYPGKSFAFGDNLDEALIQLNDYPGQRWTCMTNAGTNQNGYLRIMEVSDYGAPEIGIPYFGKKVKLSFAGTMTNQDGKSWTVTNGEAVLLFKYYTF